MKRFPEKKSTIAARLSFCPMRRLLLSALLVWLVSSGIAGATDSQVYYWTDDNGVRHFSNLPPEKPVEEMGRMQEIPYDEEADQARMEEDKAWMMQEKERAERKRRQEAEEKAAKEAKEAEEQRLAAERQQAEEDARQQEQAALKEARESRRSTADKSVFVNPGGKIPGISNPPKPTPLPSGRSN